MNGAVDRDTLSTDTLRQSDCLGLVMLDTSKMEFVEKPAERSPMMLVKRLARLADLALKPRHGFLGEAS